MYQWVDSLPKNYDRMMPKQVLLYFSYEHSHLDRRSRSVLYKNVLSFVEPGTKLYKSYERFMEQFAMEQLFESRINSRLAVIYKHMIYKEMIDHQVAGVLPAISTYTNTPPGLSTRANSASATGANRLMMPSAH